MHEGPFADYRLGGAAHCEIDLVNRIPSPADRIPMKAM